MLQSDWCRATLLQSPDGRPCSAAADMVERRNVVEPAGVRLIMTETLKLPVLPLAYSVLLPGMVVPVRLDQP